MGNLSKIYRHSLKYFHNSSLGIKLFKNKINRPTVSENKWSQLRVRETIFPNNSARIISTTIHSSDHKMSELEEMYSLLAKVLNLWMKAMKLNALPKITTSSRHSPDYYLALTQFFELWQAISWYLNTVVYSLNIWYQNI